MPRLWMIVALTLAAIIACAGQLIVTAEGADSENVLIYEPLR